MKKYILLFAVLLLANMIFAQNATISGVITDGKSGETLIGAIIFEPNKDAGTATNSYGFYSLTLPKGDVSITFSYVGYKEVVKTFKLMGDSIINLKLELSNMLEGITITASRLGVQSTQMSAVEIPIEQIKKVPAFLGEIDVIKALQLLPGIQSGTEGSAGFYVRGGGPDQNLILLDEIPLYNVNHAMGFFSVFNADALKNVTLYKGNFPARFGERLSSVIDVRMKDGDMSTYHGGVSVGLIASKINFEGPIIKDKTSFNISARRTYLDALIQPFIKIATDGAAAGYYFYDINAKINHIFSEKDRLYFSFYLGDDGVYFSESDTYNEVDYEATSKMNLSLKWGNLITALRWNHIINSKLFVNTSVAYSRYRFNVSIGNEEETIYRGGYKEREAASISYNSGINDFIFKTDFDYTLNSKNDIKFGANVVMHQFRPEVVAAKGNDFEGELPEINNPLIYAGEFSLYSEDNIMLFKNMKANLGLRYSSFGVQQKFYNSIQPRLSFRYLINRDLSVKAGYSYMSQYVHLLANSNLNMPTDLWVPVTANIKPMNTHQVAIGAFYNLKKIVDFSLEAYYKTMNNIIEYKDGATFFGISTNWEEKVNTGKGSSYGIEVLVQKSVGNTTGWIGYTWSKSERLFDRKGQEINFGKKFPAKYDRRHDISITVSHKFNEKIDVGATWVFSTGNATTLALQEYYSLNLPDGYRQRINYISSRNNYRMPAYHRLDLGVNFHRKFKRRLGERTWNISIYNVYNNMNPFMIFPDRYDEQNNKYILEKITLFPIIPSISYNWKF